MPTLLDHPDRPRPRPRRHAGPRGPPPEGADHRRTSASIRPPIRSTWATWCRSWRWPGSSDLGGRPIALVGGGTGMVGDPSGKRTERRCSRSSRSTRTPRRFEAQLAHFLDFEGPTAARRDATTPTGSAPLGLMEFLRDTGKHFTVNYMLQKESVKSRMETGISLHRVQLHAGAGLRLLAPLPDGAAASCRWAAATSGATSPPASS